MNRRNFIGLIVLAAALASVLYLWQPWNASGLSPIRLGLDLQGGLRVVLQAEEVDPTREDLNAARRVVENRVNAFGVAEPLIQTQGGNRIVVELPGLSSADQERALDLIGQQAMLEFRLVRSASQGRLAQEMTAADLEPAAFTGEILRTARADFARLGGATVGGAVVVFEIQGTYVSQFADFTGRNIGRRMAIVLDGSVISAPVINSRIGESGEITGLANLEEAGDLALVLRSGNLPISLRVEEVRAIGPTLGQDSIAAGTRAALIGAGAVVLAILLYFGPLFGGVLAIGLGLVLLFVFGALAGLGAALTLPGLAGLVLTIGAAVDGNVISFERIKEELREGKSLRLAMRGGFGNSLSAIIDANVTTLLAALTLFQYTSGPVRGFAITLAIGIVAAVFVNTVVVPFLLELLTLRIKRPLLPNGFYVQGIKFVRSAPVAIALSGLLVATSLFVLATRPLNLSTDFTGGTTALYRVSADTGVTEVRTAIDALGLPGFSGANATVQHVEDPAVEGALISVRVGLNPDGTANNIFAPALADALGAELLQADVVGPAVGGDLRTGAIMAVLVAFALILLYTAWRFWPNWIVAVATVLATIHDVLIVMGFLDLTGAVFSIPVLAALLFVVGYSLNDSIIISDRIRENLRKLRDRSYEEVVDLSVNQTLSRTVLTSATTLLPVLSLLFFGGAVLRDFSLTLLVGIGIGTYSSIFVLAPLVVWFKKRQQLARATPRRRTA